MQNSHRQLVLILIAAFTILQLLILAIFGYTPYPDSNGYISIAEECIAGNDWYPIATKINDYPFLWNIGAINAVVWTFKLFHSVTPLLVVYSLMKGITAGLFYAVTRKTNGSHAALVALILYIVYPANYGEGTSVLSELPFMFFIMLGIYLSLVRNYSIIGGMMLATANWFRPMGIVFLVALLIFFLFKWRKSLKLIIGYAVMITIIGCASMHRTGLFLYQAKTGWMALMDDSSDHAQKSMKVRERTDWNVAQKDSAWQSLFIDWLKDHPKDYLAQMPSKLVNTYISDNVNLCTFIPDKNDKEYMYEEISLKTIIHQLPHWSAVQWLTILNLAFYYILLMTALTSLFYYSKETHLLPISIILSGTILLLLVGHGEARLHIPFMPFFIMLAASFVDKRVWKG